MLSPRHPETPELLAPAGDWDCVRAAVANGADAVYFGLPRFNARLRAHNFTEAELPDVVAFCHRHGVKAYVAFNTLVFTGELSDAAEYLRLLNRAGVDALIVQDVGLVRLAREITPDLPIHASTQMTITSPEGAEFARELGVERVVLARELSLRELEKFHAGSGDSDNSNSPRGLRPRRALRRLFRPVPHERIARPAQRESRRMRAGLPHAVRIDRRRRVARSW